MEIVSLLTKCSEKVAFNTCHKLHQEFDTFDFIGCVMHLNQNIES